MGDDETNDSIVVFVYPKRIVCTPIRINKYTEWYS